MIPDAWCLITDAQLLITTTMATPALFRLSHEDRKAAIDKLVEGASPNAEFYLLLVLSTIITTWV